MSYEIYDNEDAFLAAMRSPTADTIPSRDSSRTIQFTIARSAWDTISLDGVRRFAGTSVRYDARFGGNDHWMVTCGEDAAVAIVKLLASAGQRRAAVQLRRTIRQTKNVTSLGAQASSTNLSILSHRQGSPQP